MTVDQRVTKPHKADPLFSEGQLKLIDLFIFCGAVKSEEGEQLKFIDLFIFVELTLCFQKDN